MAPIDFREFFAAFSGTRVSLALKRKPDEVQRDVEGFVKIPESDRVEILIGEPAQTISVPFALIRSVSFGDNLACTL